MRFDYVRVRLGDGEVLTCREWNTGAGNGSAASDSINRLGNEIGVILTGATLNGTLDFRLTRHPSHNDKTIFGH